jgi:hypothetical protein
MQTADEQASLQASPQSCESLKRKGEWAFLLPTLERCTIGDATALAAEGPDFTNTHICKSASGVALKHHFRILPVSRESREC